MKKCIVFLLIISFLRLSAQKRESNIKEKDSIHQSSHTNKCTYEYDYYLKINNQNALIGDMVLTESKSQIKARNSHGVLLKNVKVETCDPESKPKFDKKEKILKVKKTFDGFTVKTILYYNCSQSILADMNVSKEGRLNIQYLPYGDYAYCDCYHNATFFLNTKELEEFDSKKITSISVGNGSSIKISDITN